MTVAKRWGLGKKTLAIMTLCTVCRALGRHRTMGTRRVMWNKGSRQLRVGVGAEAGGGSVRFPSWSLLSLTPYRVVQGQKSIFVKYGYC